MTVSIMIEMDPAQREFAERLVRDGAFADVSSVVQAGLEQMMRDDAAVWDDLPSGTMDEIARRMELPRDQWPEWDMKKLSESVKARLAEKYKS